MRAFKKHSVTVMALCAGLAVAAGLAMAGPPGQSYTTAYYPDATRTGDPVGGNHATCGGQFSSWGQVTPYYIRVFSQCR